MKKIIGIVFVLFSMFVGSLFAGKQSGMPGAFGGGYVPQYNREWSKVQTREQMLKFLQEINKELITEKDDDTKSELQRLKTDTLTTLGEMGGSKDASKQYAELLARGIAGEDWEMLDGVKADGAMDGIGKGLAVRTARVFGNAVGEKLQDTMKAGIGGIWDWIIDRTKDGYRFIFHDANKPFTRQEIENGWRPLIISTLNDLSAMLRDGLRDISRSQTDMSLRQPAEPDSKDLKDAKDPAIIKVDSLIQQPMDSFWTVFINGYVEQFDYLAKLMEERKDYYDEDDIIVFYADQIKRRLLELKDLLLKAKSLKDLDAMLGSNKSLIVAERNNIDSLLVRLAACVDSGVSAGKTTATTTSSYSGYSKGDRLGLNDPMDDTYPGSLGGKGSYY